MTIPLKNVDAALDAWFRTEPELGMERAMQAALEAAMADEDDIRDAMLFRLWIRLCEHSACRVAKALAHCVRPVEYREALAKLALEEGVNLPPPKMVGYGGPIGHDF